MIHGIGTDIIRFGQLREAFLTEQDPFMRRTFSQGEILEGNRQQLREQWFSSRYACKEAVFKALRTSPEKVELSEIEICSDADGAPVVVLHGDMKRRAEAAGIRRIHISLSREKDCAVAFAAAEK